MATDPINALPFTAEYAKSARSSCKVCKGKIEKEELRIAMMVQSRHHDGRDAHWHHLACFFKKKHPKNSAEIGKFETLRWEDQQKINGLIGASGDTATPAGKGKKGPAKSAIYNDFGIEYAKSAKSSCVACENNIANKEVRIFKMDHNSDAMTVAGISIPRYHHVKCFLMVKEELGFDGTATELPGYKLMKKDDKKMLTEQFASCKSKQIKRKKSETETEVPAKVPKQETATSATAAAATSKPKLTLEVKIKMQNDKMYQIRDFLNSKWKDKELKRKDIQELLRYNGQASNITAETVSILSQTMLDRLSDVMTFGAFLPCDKCGGQFEYLSGVGYQCTGNISEFTRCLNKVQNPPRKEFLVPPDLIQIMPGYRFKHVLDRVELPRAPLPSTSNGSGFVKINESLLSGFVFVISTDLPVEMQDAIEKRLAALKGKRQTTFGPEVLALISSRVELKKGVSSPNISQALANDIPVVTVQFATDLSPKSNLLKVLKEHVISEWTVLDQLHDKMKMINKSFEPQKKEKEIEKRSKLERKGENIRVVLKGGYAVDPDCEIAETTHVYKAGKLVYTVTLKRTDVDANLNSFYKMQLLEDDKAGGHFHVFRSWGRIGSTIGGTKLDNDLNLHDAMHIFNEMFEKQSGNVFGQKFKIKPNKYIMMDIAYEAPPEQDLSVSSESNLPKSVQELVCLIFDVRKMLDTLIEFELDTNKMPLGKISREQLLNGFRILNDLMKVLEKPSEKQSEREIVDFTNRFFSMIPHSFGMGAIPILKTKLLVQEKVEMLEQLMDIELAYEMIRDGKDSQTGVSVDNHYLKLKASIEPVEKMSTDYDFIEKYLKNTHAATHSTYALSIHEIFKVQRKEENERFEPFKSFENRQLLWHGSRTTNFAGILSQGLRIAPKEAPVTGYMFGKGIYFADMVSKSANYCNPSNNVGLLLLCEVALGKMKPLTEAKDTLVKAPRGFNSVLGVGQTQPDPSQVFTLENEIKVPYGTPVKNVVKSELLYNEYIVYDVGQVRIRYLVNVNFEDASRRRRQ